MIMQCKSGEYGLTGIMVPRFFSLNKHSFRAQAENGRKKKKYIYQKQSLELERQQPTAQPTQIPVKLVDLFASEWASEKAGGESKI